MFQNLKLWLCVCLLCGVYGRIAPLKSLDPDVKISTSLDKVTFYLWTPEFGFNNPLHFNADLSAEVLLMHGFNPDRNTKVISHGWNSDAIDFCDNFVEAYFTHAEPSYNIIGIDWSPLATWDNYYIAAKNAIKVGNHAAEVIGKLILQQLGQHPHQIHAIGHSLGGHLVGHFGRRTETFFGMGKISRVTSLDPAGPWFDISDKSNRVRKSDAELVDVIHTNSGSILDLCLSLPDPLGHVDFYPNGGSHQAGCHDICLASICTESNLIDLLNGACSHGRVKDFYVESILDSRHEAKFLSKCCDSWSHFENDDCHDQVQLVQMGEGLEINSLQNVDQSSKFYLSTREDSPYSHPA